MTPSGNGKNMYEGQGGLYSRDTIAMPALDDKSAQISDNHTPDSLFKLRVMPSRCKAISTAVYEMLLPLDVLLGKDGANFDSKKEHQEAIQATHEVIADTAAIVKAGNAKGYNAHVEFIIPEGFEHDTTAIQEFLSLRGYIPDIQGIDNSFFTDSKQITNMTATCVDRRLSKKRPAPHKAYATNAGSVLLLHRDLSKVLKLGGKGHHELHLRRVLREMIRQDRKLTQINGHLECGGISMVQELSRGELAINPVTLVLETRDYLTQEYPVLFTSGCQAVLDDPRGQVQSYDLDKPEGVAGATRAALRRAA